MKLSSLVTLLFAVATLTPLACKSSKPTSENTDAVDSSRLCRVTFNGDSAMNYARAQCDFGPRTPNSAALKKCGDYIVGRFKALGLTVTEQRTTVTGWDGKQLGCRNIIAAFHPERKDRVVIAAHYDSRPWAEKDADSSRHHTPVMAADDGASGVAVLLEVARHLAELNPKIGVDLVCFDAEDYGAPYWAPENKRDDESTFCLGSQYWSKQLAADYKPRYGILLDMVGGKLFVALCLACGDKGVGCRAPGRCRRLFRAGIGRFHHRRPPADEQYRGHSHHRRDRLHARYGISRPLAHHRRHDGQTQSQHAACRGTDVAASAL